MNDCEVASKDNNTGYAQCSKCVEHFVFKEKVLLGCSGDKCTSNILSTLVRTCVVDKCSVHEARADAKG